MGAPKQRWTSEEEAALKAGINKYGAGKWSTILKDPEFNTVLRSRSNVDLKDKWRNMNCMASGLGSRHKASAAHKNSQLAPKQDEGTTAATADSMVVEKDSVVIEAKPLAQVKETVQDAIFRNQISSVDDLILEAITKLKEPRGSSLRTIVEYIEDHHSAPPDFERFVAANLKVLTEKGRLVKVKHQYRIAPTSISLDRGKVGPANGAKRDLPQVQRNGIVVLTKAEIDAELEKMKGMSADEAAAAAARAVAEAEAAIAAAEAAAVEAEEAEVEAEAAQCFLDAAQKAIKSISIRAMK